MVKSLRTFLEIIHERKHPINSYMKFLILLLSLFLTTAHAAPDVVFIFSSGPASGSKLVIDAFSQCFDKHGLSSINDFKPGAGGIIGIQALKNYSGKPTPVLVGGTGLNMFSSFPNIDMLEDINPVAFITTEDIVVVTKANGPINSLAALVALSKTRSINAGTATVTATWTIQHLFKELNIPYTLIPYKSSTDAHTDVLSGTIDVEADLYSGSKALISADKFAIVSSSFSRKEGTLMRQFVFSPVMNSHTGGIILNVRPDASQSFRNKLMTLSTQCATDPDVISQLAVFGSRPRNPVTSGDALRSLIREVRADNHE